MASRLLSRQNGLLKRSLFSRTSTNYTFNRSFSSVPSHSTNITKLSNGMRVASEDNFGETATVGIWLDAGSSYETKENNGTAHFLEHMAFKGTSKRSQEQLELEIENMGGKLNAYTAREQTVYVAHVLKNDVPKAVDILSDILLNSTYSEDAIRRERNVILREMEEVEKQEEEVVMDYLHSIAFQGTSMAHTILGPPENVNSIQRSHLEDYVKNFYVAPRMCLVGAGGVEHEQLVSLAEKHFSGLPTTGGEVEHVKPKFTGSMVTIRNDEMPNVYMAIAVESVGWSHPDFLTFCVIQALMGNWDYTAGAGNSVGSCMAERLALTDPLVAKRATTFNTPYHETGLFGAYAVCRPENADDVPHVIMNEWLRMATTVRGSEVERAKNTVLSTLMMSLDGTTPIAEDIGRQLLTLGRRATPNEIAARLNAIDVDEVRRVGWKYFHDVCPAIVAMGPIGTLPDYNTLRGNLVWWRM